MDIYAKGQLSFLILNCLLERDFYGLDIISEISSRTNGRIDLKKPSVYSNLTRMEKQGQVSSYMRSSDVGPNRRYYSITEKGRQTYQSLKEEFERNHFNVFRDFNEFDNETEAISTPVVTPAPMIEDENEDEEMEIRQEDFFDFSSLEDKKEEPAFKAEPTPAPVVKEEPQIQYVQEETIKPVQEVKVVFEQPQPVMEQITIQEAPIVEKAPIMAEQEEIKEVVQEVKEEVKNDAVFLDKTDINDPNYNKRIYDITKDFNKYRKRRSFAEDQMSIEVTEKSLQESETKKQQNLDNFKSALLESKGRYSDRLSEEDFKARHSFNNAMQTPVAPVEEKQEEVVEDDGVFITTRVVDHERKPRKIEPPRLKITAEHNPLPAPKRDTNIDPSHKEIISRLYSKSKGSENELVDDSTSLYDYEDLADHYYTQQIMFKTYEHDKVTVKHNTNKINMFVSVFTFSLMCIISAIMFGVLYSQNLTNPNTSFLYIILPGIFVIDVLAKVSAMKYTSWEPKPLMAQWKMWLLLLFSCGAIVGLNFIFGLATGDLLQYFATLFFPIAILITLLPIQYYVKRFAYVKYWK